VADARPGGVDEPDDGLVGVSPHGGPPPVASIPGDRVGPGPPRRRDQLEAGRDVLPRPEAVLVIEADPRAVPGWPRRPEPGQGVTQGCQSGGQATPDPVLRQRPRREGVGAASAEAARAMICGRTARR
jgi:hypothetical protein